MPRARTRFVSSPQRGYWKSPAVDERERGGGIRNWADKDRAVVRQPLHRMRCANVRGVVPERIYVDENCSWPQLHRCGQGDDDRLDPLVHQPPKQLIERIPVI